MIRGFEVTAASVECEGIIKDMMKTFEEERYENISEHSIKFDVLIRNLDEGVYNDGNKTEG